MACEHGHCDELDSAPPDARPRFEFSLSQKLCVALGLGFLLWYLWPFPCEAEVEEVSFPWKGAQVGERVPWYLLRQDLCLQERINGRQAAVFVA